MASYGATAGLTASGLVGVLGILVLALTATKSAPAAAALPRASTRPPVVAPSQE